LSAKVATGIGAELSRWLGAGPVAVQGGGVGGRRQVADRRVGPRSIEIVDPTAMTARAWFIEKNMCSLRHSSRKPPLEALREGVLRGLARRNVAPIELGGLGEGEDCGGRELGLVARCR